MNAKEFFDKVSKMRKLQCDYYKCPRSVAEKKADLLSRSKEAEREIDEEIKRVMELKFNPEIKFENEL